MHIGWVAMLGLRSGQERLDVGLLSRRLKARLHLAPRFRQVVAAPPGGMALPRWVDDQDFALDQHLTVQRSATPLRKVVDEFFSTALPRDRPLWQIHVVPRLPGRRAALIGKVHHAMVDGLAAVQLGMLLFDAEAVSAVDSPVPWKPAPPPGPVRLAASSVADTALDQFRAARGAAALGVSPARGVRLAQSTRRAALRVAEDFIRPAPPSYLNGAIGPRRTLVSARLPVDRLHQARSRAGASLNDVVLELVAGALHRLARQESHEPEDLRVMVPASVRGGSSSADGNAIAFLLVDLPISLASPRDRLELIVARMRQLKSGDSVAGSYALTELVAHLPGPLQARAANFATSQRLYNLTVSNVPGPPLPLYAAGARVTDIQPVIPIPERHALAVGAFSYDRHLTLSAYADPEALPAVRRLPRMALNALIDLEQAFA